MSAARLKPTACAAGGSGPCRAFASSSNRGTLALRLDSQQGLFLQPRTVTTAAIAADVASPSDAYEKASDLGAFKAHLHIHQIIMLGCLGGFYIGFGSLLMLCCGASSPGLAHSNPGLAGLPYTHNMAPIVARALASHAVTICAPLACSTLLWAGCANALHHVVYMTRNSNFAASLRH